MKKKNFGATKNPAVAGNEKIKIISDKISAINIIVETGANFFDYFKKKDYSEIVYYNCNKKDYISQNCC